jgi:hypothetical protein
MRSSLITFVSIVALAAGCGSSKPAATPAHKAPPAASSGGVAKPAQRDPTKPRAFHVVTLGERTLGPFLASRRDLSLAAYVGPAETGPSQRVVAFPVTDDGAPSGEARTVAPVQGEASALVVRATGGATPGFVAAWTSLVDRAEALMLAGIADDGQPRAEHPTELARTSNHIVWVEVVPTPRGGVCVWAEETRGGDANVLAAALDPDGRMRGVPARVARSVTGWQATAAGDGVGLALVSPDPNAKNAKGGTLSWLRLDAEGAPIGVPVPVLAKPVASGDVEVVMRGDSPLFAWTDRSATDPALMIAALDGAGKIVDPPHAAVEAKSGAVLLGAASGPAGVVLAWEEPSHRIRTTRKVHLTRLGSKQGGERRTTLDVVGRGAPELVATEQGFSVLVQARACKPADASDTCGYAPALPTVVRFDAQLEPLQAEPLTVGDPPQPTALGWGLRCTAGRCVALAATPESPSRIHTVSLPARTNDLRPPVVTPPPEGAPRIATLTTLASGAEYADMSATKVDGGTLVAMLTSAVEAKGQGAQVLVRALDASGKPAGAPITISSRALTAGGVSIAAGGTPDDGAALAWVARENGEPQVHVTRVDKHGRRQNDVQLTTKKGSAADVAIAWADGGWIVAWVDGRDGNGEVYATKVGTDLNRVAREERITNAPGDASDVTLLVRPNAVWLAWADPRENPHEGFSDVYVTSLRPRDAKRATDEVRVLASAAHSRSPALAPAGDGVAVAWIEEAPHDASRSEAYGAMLARVDAKGTLLDAPVRMRSAGPGAPSSVALDASTGSLRAVVARATPDDLVLDAIELGDTGPGRAFLLHTLEGPPTLDVALNVLDGVLFFNDEGTEDRRALRATLSWKR